MHDAMTTSSAATRARGVTPWTINAEGMADHEIRYAVARSRLGWVLVAATERGIRGIDLDAVPRRMIERLRVRFPQSRPRQNDAACVAWAALVATFIEAPGGALDLPLDIAGTEVQRRVWDILRQIPLGETASYGAIAKLIGPPVTAQEVAQACAANSFAVAIPCHRVVRSDGRLGGYRWGYGRKRALLRREREAAAPR